MLLSLDIIIVNWNAGQQLRECLESIISTMHDSIKLSRLVVVDNASNDGSLDGLYSLSLPLTIICNPINIGFGAACNQGAAEATGDYLLFLNPDTRLFENSLSASVAFMQRPENADIGIAGIQLANEDNNIARSCSRFPSLGFFIAQALGLNRLPGLQHLSLEMSEWAHDQTVAVDQVIGAFFLMRRSLFDFLGGFDQRFFVYFEEVDLAFRARQAGWRSVYLAEARAFHAEGGTSRQVKAHRLFYSLRSRLLYGFKHFTSWQAWVLFGVTLVVELVSRTIFSLLRGGGQDVRNTLRGYSMLYRDLPNIVFRLRKTLMEKKKLSRKA